MIFFLVLGLALFVVFLIFIGRQSGSIQSGRKSQEKSWPDTNSDLFLVSNTVPQSLFDSVHEANNVTDSVVNSDLSAGFVDYSNTCSTGGELGTALADAVDGGGNGFGAVDSGSSDVGGGGTSDWN